MNAVTLKSLQSNNPVLADGHSPRHVWIPGCVVYGSVLRGFCGWLQRHGCIGHSGCVGTVLVPLEGERFLLPAAGSSGTAEAGAKNHSLERAPCSCFLRSRPLLLVLPSSETGEFPSFIYIITLKVFIDCDWGPLSLLSLRLCKFSSRSPCSHILPSNSSLASLYFL